VTFTKTSGPEDTGSPHRQDLSGDELNTGAHNNITLTDTPTLVDGAIYSIAFDATDAAGNDATPVTSTGVTYDVTTTVPTLAIPAASSTDNSTIAIDFTLPEAASSGTVKMTFTRTGGSEDDNSPHTVTFDNDNGFETAGQHSASLNGSNLVANENVASATADALLVDDAIYSVTIEYQDEVGNTAASATNSTFTYDITVPTISSTAPAQDASIKDTKVSYTLSEAVASGTVTFTRTGIAGAACTARV